jgi:hypothetical protein
MKPFAAVVCAGLMACASSKPIEKPASAHDLAQELIRTQSKQSYEATLSAFMQALLTGFEKSRAVSDRIPRPELKRIVSEVMIEELPYDAILGGLAAFYERHFSADELRELVAMRRSTVFQKEMDLLPTMMQEMSAESTALLAERMPRIQAKVKERLAAMDKH